MRLTKSRDDVVLAGVLGGIGEYYHIDPTLLRIGFVVLVFLNVFPLIPLYIIGALLIPEAPRFDKEKPRRPQARKRSRNRRPHRERPRRDFDMSRDYQDYEEFPSSKTSEVDEDDWSDF